MVRFHTVAVGAHKVFYREAGDPSRPTLLLLHGFPSSSHMFRNLIPLLADRFHIVAPDLPGNTLVSELTTAMVGSATAYADSTSASCGEGTHMQSGQCAIDCGYTAATPGRRLSDGADGADGAADGASRGWRDRDPLEDAVAAVGRLLAKEPEQAAPLFRHLEPMLEAALSEDA